MPVIAHQDCALVRHSGFSKYTQYIPMTTTALTTVYYAQKLAVLQAGRT